ncbi:MAG: DUF1343 domain-containing protein [Kiritimatiellaeota bacterium]|nr:DUF1343 domain-containing protein [Kiritimatiellota bacterium]
MLDNKIISLVFSMTILATIPRSAEARVYSGLEVFLARHVKLVRGKRVGLITNPTGVDAKLNSTVDLLRANPNVNLVALFAPEHGIRGDVRAGQNVPGGRDPGTGIPVYTLYGAGGHRPGKAALSKVDVLIYDIQDVGSRAYTYIWHLAECMSAAAEAGKTVIVLDRPNPLGASVVDGPVSEKAYLSFIGLYPIPRVYGLTVGELARYLNTEEKIRCRLLIVPMVNYKRGMVWSQTGLPWVPTSPNIPTPEAACAFAATGTIGETGCLSIGIGYTLPFQVVAAPWINAEKMAGALNRLRLPGVRFRPIHYKPFYAAYANKYVHGVQLIITNPGRFRPATTETAILCHLQKHYSSPRMFSWRADKTAGFDKAMGTSLVRRRVAAGEGYRAIVDSWRAKLNAFKRKRLKYLIYK